MKNWGPRPTIRDDERIRSQDIMQGFCGSQLWAKEPFALVWLNVRPGSWQSLHAASVCCRWVFASLCTGCTFLGWHTVPPIQYPEVWQICSRFRDFSSRVWDWNGGTAGLHLQIPTQDYDFWASHGFWHAFRERGQHHTFANVSWPLRVWREVFISFLSYLFIIGSRAQSHFLVHSGR